VFRGVETGIIVIFWIIVFFSQIYGKLRCPAGSGRLFTIPHCFETGLFRNKTVHQFHKLADKTVRLFTVAERNYYNSPYKAI